jgi:hypothetical protein
MYSFLSEKIARISALGGDSKAFWAMVLGQSAVFSRFSTRLSGSLYE